MRPWTCSGMLTLAGIFVLVLAAEAASRTNEEEISRLLSRLRREPKSATVLRELGGRYAIRASEEGYPTDIEDSRKYLDAAEKIEPKSPKLFAWKGILRLVEAKIRGVKGYVNEGLRLLDRAVGMEPDSLVLRMLRGSADLEVPREFGRLAEGIADLEMIEAAHRKDPAALPRLELDPAEVHLKLGNGYRGKGDLERSISYWRQVVSESPSSKESDSARRLLRKHGAPDSKKP